MKKIILFIVLISMILLIYGCSQNQTISEEQEVPSKISTEENGTYQNETSITETSSDTVQKFQTQDVEEYHFPDGQKLCLIVKKDPENGYHYIPKADLGGNFNDDLIYWNISEVSLLLDGKAYALEDVIQSGQVAPEELVAWAMVDARNGFCNEKIDTHMGLTDFVYQYPGYEIGVMNDIFETPSDDTHLFRILDISLPDGHKNMRLGFTYFDENGNKIDLLREDWGLDFSVENVSCTGLTLHSKHSKGQEQGDLYLKYAYITNSKDGGYPLVVEKLTDEEILADVMLTEQDDFNLDWTRIMGELPVDPGNQYALVIVVEDHYDPDTVPGIQKNYTDKQEYVINLDIR